MVIFSKLVRTSIIDFVLTEKDPIFEAFGGILEVGDGFELCIELCKKQNLVGSDQFIGITSASQCFCGVDWPTKEAKVTKNEACADQIPCPDDETKKCGSDLVKNIPTIHIPENTESSDGLKLDGSIPITIKVTNWKKDQEYQDFKRDKVIRNAHAVSRVKQKSIY